MASVVRYQPSVSPSSAGATSSSIGTGFNTLGQNVEQGLDAAITGLYRLNYQDRITREGNLHASADRIVSDIHSEVDNNLDEVHRGTVKNQTWAGYKTSALSVVDNAYDPTDVASRIAEHAQDEQDKSRLQALVYDKLGSSKAQYYEKVRQTNSLLNITSANMDTQGRLADFATAIRSGKKEDVVLSADVLKAHFDDRVANLTLKAEDAPKAMDDAITNALLTRFHRALDSGSITAYQDHVHLTEVLSNYMSLGANAKSAEALKGLSKEQKEANLASYREWVASAKGEVNPNILAEYHESFGLTRRDALEEGAKQNHALFDSMKSLEEIHDRQAERQSDWNYQQFTLEAAQIYSKSDPAARSLALQELEKKIQVASPMMLEKDRKATRDTIANFEKDLSDRPTDPLAYGLMEEHISQHLHDRNLMARIAANPKIGGTKKTELMTRVSQLRQKFSDDKERFGHEAAMKVFETKHDALNEATGPRAAQAMAGAYQSLYRVILEGENSADPELRNMHIAYKRNPSLFAFDLMEEAKKQATQMTLLDGAKVYETLKIKPTSVAGASNAIKNELDTSTDEGKNSATALQLYMKTLYRTPQEEKADTQANQELKDKAKKLERIKK